MGFTTVWRREWFWDVNDKKKCPWGFDSTVVFYLCKISLFSKWKNRLNNVKQDFRFKQEICSSRHFSWIEKLVYIIFSCISAKIGWGGVGGAIGLQVPTALNSIDCLWLQLQKIWKIWCLLQSEMIAKAVQWAEKNFNSIKRSWEVKYTGHGIFIECWNTTKYISTIWQRFMCLLDEGLRKYARNFIFTMFFWAIQEKNPIQPILHQFFAKSYALSM
jgi:hypothetical protein